MAENPDSKVPAKARARRALSLFTKLLLLALAFFYFILKLYTSSPLAPAHLSTFLTGFAGAPVRVSAISLTGGTVSIYGVTIGNPAGYASPNLLSVASLSISPAWRDLAVGKKSFHAIRVSGLRIEPVKNRLGEWNFTPLLKRLSAGKSATETFIDLLSVDDAALRLDGRAVEQISLTLRDLSTKGSTNSRFVLSCKESHGIPFRLEGEGRMGSAPSLQLVLSSPRFQASQLRAFVKMPPNINLEKGSGELFITAKMGHGIVAADGRVRLKGIGARVGKGQLPLDTLLTFAGNYATERDEARLSCRLILNELIKVTGTGRIDGVKGERAYGADISLAAVKLADIFKLLPQAEARGLRLTGELANGRFRIAGSAKSGITEAKGEMSLRNSALLKNETLLFEGMHADLSLEHRREGWVSGGKVSIPAGGGKASLEFLDAPFQARLSPRMKPLYAEVPRFTARVMGIPANGSLSFAQARPKPIFAAINIPETSLSTLTRFLDKKNSLIGAGKGSVALNAAGTTTGEMAGLIRVKVADMDGKLDGKAFSLKGAESAAALNLSAGRLSAAGKAVVNNGAFDNRKYGAEFDYAVADRKLTLKNGRCDLDGTAVRFAAIGADIAGATAAGGMNTLPVRVTASGLEITKGKAALKGLSGSMDALYIVAPGSRWLEGRGGLSLSSLEMDGNTVGAFSALLSFRRGEAAADIKGTLLEGNLASIVRMDPFGDKKALFTLSIKDLRGEKLAKTLGRRFSSLSGGVMQGNAQGSYSTRDGLFLKGGVMGEGIALSGASGKGLISGGAVKLTAEVRGQDLFVTEGTVSVGEGITMSGHGNLLRFASPSRSGEFTCSLPEVPLNSLADSFANILPKALQEANITGNSSAALSARINEGRTLVQGEARFSSASLDIPSQKINISGIAGALPFSFDLSGRAAERTKDAMSYTRENYPLLLKALSNGAKVGQPLTIAKVSLGTIEIGETRFRIRAENGLMEMASLESALYGGGIYGKGFLRYNNGMQFGGDMLINDMSLREFCESIPAIKGYISGKLKGIISIRGGEKGLEGMTGFVDLWSASARGEKMELSKEFLQKLAGKKLRGIFFRDDRPYDRGEIGAYLEKGFLTFYQLDISHTNFLGIRDLSVSVAPVQNRIAISHLFEAIKEAAARGKRVSTGEEPIEPATQPQFKWEE